MTDNGRVDLKDRLIRELRAGFLETNRALATQAASNVADLLGQFLTPDVTSLTQQAGAFPFGTPVRHRHGKAVGTIEGYRIDHVMGTAPHLWYRVNYGDGEVPWISASLVEVA